MGRIIIVFTALVFAGVIVRLASQLHSSSREHRRRARRFLIMSAMVPALILVPAAVEAAGPEYAPVILLAAAVWLTLAMALTSFLLAYATRPRRIRLTRSHPKHHLPGPHDAAHATPPRR